MPRRSLKQDSFFNPEFVCPTCLEEGTMAWLLARHRSNLFPQWLFKGWRGQSRLGRNAWPPEVLMTLVLLRFSEQGISRRAASRRANVDATWRAAMGLHFGIAPPDEKTVRSFEKFLRQPHSDAQMPRFMLFHEHVVRLCQKAGVVEKEPIWVTDSTPMWCYGAVIDTVRLLGEGVKQVAKTWADARRVSVERVAQNWQVDWILAPSIKGAFRVDWSDKHAKDKLVTRLAHIAIEAVERVRRGLDEVRRGKRKRLVKQCRNLMKVVEQNLEASPQGGLQVAQRVAVDRLISLTDPQARHGRKSKSHRFNGFKLHVLGDAVSGLILSLAVTAGNIHDGQPAPRLIRRAKGLCKSMQVVLGDTAYGATRLRIEAEKSCGVKIIAPPPKGPPGQGLGKEAFELDLAQGIAICPNGVTSRDLKYLDYGNKHGEKAPRFLWPRKICQECPLFDECRAPRKKGNSRMRFHPHEQKLRAIRAEWDKPETRQEYKKRAQGERLIKETVRRGARKAMAWGLGSAELQAYVIVMVNNLSLLARNLAEQEAPGVFDVAA